MAYSSFKRVLMLFKSTTEHVTGEQILKELNGLIDTDSADVQVDDHSLQVQFVTAEPHGDMLERCNSVKEKVDSLFHERLFYKLVVMSL